MSLTPSSPRLPSPPPPTEIQLGPKSPAALGSPSNQESAMEQSVINANSTRRIHPGTKSVDMAAGPPLIPLLELDSAFQLQEHLKALHYHCTKPDDSENGVVPINRKTALTIATPPEGVDKSLWLYELCRFLINKCNDLIVGFLFDDPPCSAQTCPEMRASEWQFLCAVHESPKSCCAIDYCCHTLDWATNIVTSQTIFPSRLSLGSGNTDAGVKHLVNIFRRLHRIFAHAWFQHRDVFWRIEIQTGLYVLFKMVCDSYELLPAENYKLPPEAEGLEPTEETKKAITPSILKPEIAASSKPAQEEGLFSLGSLGSIGRTNTRRHIRQSPSVGSAVTTVLESDDEEEPNVTQKLDDLHIAEEEETEEEGETEIPVIVETYEIDENHEDGTDLPIEEVLATNSVVEQETEVEEEPHAVDDSPPNSTTSSWDRMSSESLEDKLEKSDKDEETKEEGLSPVTKEADKEATSLEGHTSKSKEEPQELPAILTEDSSESANKTSTAREEPAEKVEYDTVKSAHK